MSCWRLFVGNLPPSVTQEELREKFTGLLEPHPSLHVGHLEIRCKNNDNYFAFINIQGDGGGQEENNVSSQPPPLTLIKCVDIINNTKWKGCLIKVQLAKESFLSKLKREREGGQSSGTQPPPPPPTYNDRRSRGGGNFDFEIVSNNNQVKKSVRNLDESEESDDEECGDGIPKFRGLLFSYPEGVKDSNPHEKPPPPQPVEEQVKGQPSSLQEDGGESEERRERFMRLQRIAGYTLAPPTTDTANKFKKPQKLEAPPPPTEQSKGGVVFRKNKQQNSDLLRQQSYDKLKDVKIHQSNLIKSSLAQANLISSDAAAANANKKRSAAIHLFGEEEGDEDYEEDFKVKRQYEGSGGQRLLELKGGWGNDERFKIDSRFTGQEGGGGQEGEEEKEKRKQLDILSDLLGTPLTHLKEGETERHHQPSEVILNRYDPEAGGDEGIVYGEGEESLQPQTKKKGKKDSKKETEAVPQEPIRSTEPSTYKMAHNLTSLFSSRVNEEGGGAPAPFSLLATFGKEDDLVIKEDSGFGVSGTVENKSEGIPRQFWESNPFKYDSSDDEEEGEGKSKKNKRVKGGNEEKSKVKEGSLGPYSTSLPIIKTTDFFFNSKDSRFLGVTEYFLNLDGIDDRVEDYDEKRRELKSIVKAKARNAKRKDEKRTIAIKRAIRKKKKYQKSAGGRSNGSGVNFLKVNNASTS